MPTRAASTSLVSTPVSPWTRLFLHLAR